MTSHAIFCQALARQPWTHEYFLEIAEQFPCQKPKTYMKDEGQGQGEDGLEAAGDLS